MNEMPRNKSSISVPWLVPKTSALMFFCCAVKIIIFDHIKIFFVKQQYETSVQAAA